MVTILNFMIKAVMSRFIMYVLVNIILRGGYDKFSAPKKV